MRATEVLRSEHRIIERVIACLQAATDQVRSGGPVDEETFDSAIDFFRGYVDDWHHRKEAEGLFPVLERLGVSRDEGPIGRMLEERELGGRYLRAMSEALPAAGSGDSAARRDLIRRARAYCDLLRGQIHAEDRVLLDLADQILPPEDEASLEATFARIGRECGADSGARLVRVADALGARWGVGPSALRMSG